jgi:hypothetical protein
VGAGNLQTKLNLEAILKFIISAIYHEKLIRHIIADTSIIIKAGAFKLRKATVFIQHRAFHYKRASQFSNEATMRNN